MSRSILLNLIYISGAWTAWRGIVINSARENYYRLFAICVLTVLLFFQLAWRLAFRLAGFIINLFGRTRQNILREHAARLVVHSNLSDKQKDWTGLVGFFHPFCNAGGGGERVLWAAIRAVQSTYPGALCVVYTGDREASKDEIIGRVYARFGISLNPATIIFVYLSWRGLVVNTTWPRFTLAGQSLGSIFLAFEAVSLLRPDVFIDTMGYAFGIAIVKLLFPDMPTAAYVHYPTISTDMLKSLHMDETKGLNAGAGKGLRGYVKQVYWEIFAATYRWAGSKVDVVMTNSSWTQYHIKTLWSESRKYQNVKDEIRALFPPVAVEKITDAVRIDEATESKRQKVLLYIAQFRPEKNHTMILRAFAQFVQTSSEASKDAQLVLIGSVRDSEDATRVYKFRLLAHELGVKDQVTFICDASWPEILDWLSKASIGVNGMWNEHFGIGVVEYQAAGLISVVNDSGGPKHDIVVEVDGGHTGYHAGNESAYAKAFETALSLSKAETIALRKRAQKSSHRFDEESFDKQWLDNMQKILALQHHNPRQEPFSVFPLAVFGVLTTLSFAFGKA